MSLAADEDMNTEEEYVDDPIQLIPQLDCLTSYSEPEEFTAYKQQSYVPVTFFNIQRNIKLLNNCRPLCIKLVDCNQYPWYYKKFNKKYSHKCHNLQTDDSDTSVDDDLMYAESESEKLNTETKGILNRMSANGLTIYKVKSKKKKKIKGVNFKKNKGLIGMKIAPTFEVIEIDDESDNCLSDNLNKENETSNEIIQKVDQNSTDIVTEELDWTIENNKREELEVNVAVGVIPVTEIIQETEYSTVPTHNDFSDDSRVEVGGKKAVLGTTGEVNVAEQKSINIKPAVSTILANVNETTMEQQDKDNIINKGDAFNKEEKNSDVSCSLNDSTPKSISENMFNSLEIRKRDNGKQDLEIVTKEDKCLKSPVFPCTPPKKIKKLTKGRHDISKLVIHHPKDFTDNKFKPNRLSSPKATSERLSEKTKFIQDSSTECINTSKHMPTSNTQTAFQAQNQEQTKGPNLDSDKIEILNKKDEMISTKVQQANTGSANLQENFNQNTNVHELTSKSGTESKSNVQNLTSYERKHDRMFSDAPNYIYKGQTNNKEQIIKLKLNEIIYKDVIGKQLLNVNNRKEAQKNNFASVISKVSSQVNKTEHLITSKISSSVQNNSNRPPAHIAEKRSSSSHTINNILADSKPIDTSKIVSKKVHILQKVGSAVLQEGANSISQGHSDKRPQILSKPRIRPFTGSISNWKSVNNEIGGPNKLSLSTGPISKNRHLGTSYLNHQQHVMAQNMANMAVPCQKPQQSIGIEINNNTTNGSAKYQIAQTDYKESTTRNDVLVPLRNGSNSLQNSNFPRNDVPLAEQKRANILQNGFPRHNSPNCYIQSFGPPPRQYVRPIMRQDGTQVLSVSNYPRQYFSNTINPNLSGNPYIGYSNNYNSYWPYQYTSMPPPPPPPPPPNSKGVVPNIPQAYVRVSAPDKNRVNVIERLAPNNISNNNISDRPNLIDINLNSTNPPKTNSIVVNKSPIVVSSKTEMFEELEKEMLNIHQEDSENFIYNQLCDTRPIDKLDNVKSDPRIKPNLNATETTPLQSVNNSAPTSSTNASKIFVSQTGEDHTKISKNNMLCLKKHSNEVISKDAVKRKKNNISTHKLPKLDKQAAGCDSSTLGYSPPILPIPTFKQTLDILTRASNDAQKQLEKTRKQTSMSHQDNTKNGDVNLKKDKVKKISLDEYKQREDKSVCERKKRNCERKKKVNLVKKSVEAKHSDQDQGYDSDSTIVL